jgi:hypothetical protein
MLCIEKIFVCLQDNLGGENDFMLATRISKKEKTEITKKRLAKFSWGGGGAEGGGMEPRRLLRRRQR